MPGGAPRGAPAVPEQHPTRGMWNRRGAYGIDRYGTYNREAMRKPVVSSPAPAAKSATRSSRGFADRDARHHHARHQPARRAAGALVAREFTGSITDASLLDRILAEFEVDCIFHLAALLSTRAEFTPVAAHHVNVEGTLNLLEFAQRAGRVARPAGHLRLPLVDRDLRPARPRDQGTRRRRSARTSIRIRRRCTAATSCTARSSGATTRGTTSSSRSTSRRTSTSARVRFPGLISATTLPSGGTSDLRVGDDSCRGAAASPTRASCGPTRRIPFMAMPDASEALLDAGGGAARAADAHDLQRRRVQPFGRRHPRGGR